VRWARSAIRVWRSTVAFRPAASGMWSMRYAEATDCGGVRAAGAPSTPPRRSARLKLGVVSLRAWLHLMLDVSVPGDWRHSA
jgi:hypothetical protein